MAFPDRGDFPDLEGYRFVRELGRGPAGVVFEAVQEAMGRPVAVKVLKPSVASSHIRAEVFLEEARATAALRHSGIAAIYDAGQQGSLYYFSRDLLGGPTLEALMEAEKPMTLGRALDLLGPVAAALDHAHAQGILHRDLKPSNLIQHDGRLVLTDFASSKRGEGGAGLGEARPVGSPQYLAPERVQGIEDRGSSDVYSLAVLLYQMVTGQLPFKGQETKDIIRGHLLKTPAAPTSLNPALPESIDQPLLKALEKDPDARPRTVSEFLSSFKVTSSAEITEDSAIDQFVAAVVAGRVSMDAAVKSQSRILQAIDEAFRRQVTVMALDLAGSSSMKEGQDHLKVDRAFRDFRSVVNNVLKDFGCTCYNWSGDGCIGLFDDAAQAVHAGLNIQEKLSEFGDRHPLGRLFKARIGINTGPVYFDPRRNLGEFASPTVDQAGHMEKDCPPGSVYVSQFTQQRAAGAAIYERLGPNRDGLVVFQARGSLKVAASSEGKPAVAEGRLAALRDAIREFESEKKQPEPGSARLDTPPGQHFSPLLSKDGTEAVRQGGSRAGQGEPPNLTLPLAIFAVLFVAFLSDVVPWFVLLLPASWALLLTLQAPPPAPSRPRSGPRARQASLKAADPGAPSAPEVGERPRAEAGAQPEAGVQPPA